MIPALSHLKSQFKKWIPIFGTTAAFFALPTQAQQVIYDPRPDLELQKKLLERIRPFISKADQPRLHSLVSSTQDVIDAVNTHVIGHRIATQEMQRLVLVFKYSESYLDYISAKKIRPTVDELRVIQKNLATIFGFDAAEGSTIVYLVLKQMSRIIEQINTLDPPERLRNELVSLRVPLGKALAISPTGDRPLTFQDADKVYAPLVTLYPLLHQVAESEVFFQPLMELIELNEFYGKYAQTSRRKVGGSTP